MRLCYNKKQVETPKDREKTGITVGMTTFYKE